ncbi:MAG: zinc-ribbon domain-containing protein [Candidatus Acidiferrales bacterium]
MPHCTKCGANVDDTAAFCGKCGAAQAGAPPPSAVPPVAGAPSQMAENVAGALCYVLGWITGIIFFLTDKRPYVRFHAAQSIVVFGALTIIGVFLGRFYGFRYQDMADISTGHALWHLVEFVLWILLIIKAYQGERFRLPLAADIADSIFGKS